MGFLDSIAVFGMSGKDIYHNFHGGTGDDARGLLLASTTVATLGKRYHDRATSITQLTTTMESAWQGSAAGAAQRGAGPLAVEHGLAQPSLTTASDTLKGQAAAFASAKGKVTQVPDEPQEPGVWDNLTSLGGAGRNYDDKMKQYNGANDHNVDVMVQYETTTSSNTSGMPTQYGRITDDYAAVGVDKPPPPPVSPPYNPNIPNPSGGGTGTGSGTRSPSRNNPPGGNVNNSPGGNSQTSPSRNNPPGGLPPGGRFPGGSPPGGGGNNPIEPGMLPPPGFGPGGGGGSGGSRGGGFGPRGGGGGFGPGGSGGAGTPGAGRGTGGFGPGGAGAAAAAEGAAGRGGMGGPGGAGRGGIGGMGGMGHGAGGRRGEGDEDTEHERPSFLVEPDPHDTFGTDEVTAPPVIGE